VIYLVFFSEEGGGEGIKNFLSLKTLYCSGIEEKISKGVLVELSAKYKTPRKAFLKEAKNRLDKLKSFTTRRLCLLSLPRLAWQN
jgi:hypothetical protein